MSPWMFWGAGRSNLGSWYSRRSASGEHDLSHDTRKLGSVSISEKVFSKLRVRDVRKLEKVFELWCVVSVYRFYTKYFSRVFMDFLRNSDNRDSGVRRIFLNGGSVTIGVRSITGVGRTRSFLLRDRGGLRCDTSGWLGYRPLASHCGQKVWCRKCFGVR